MKINVTSISNKEIHLNMEDLRKMFSIVIYPDYLQGFDTISVMIVCVRGEQHQHDAYIHEGKPYISIALDYRAVAGLPFEEITVICKNKLIAYLNTLQSLPVREVA